MAGLNQQYAVGALEKVGLEEGEPGMPGSGAHFLVTEKTVEAVKKLVGKLVIVQDSGETVIEGEEAE